MDRERAKFMLSAYRPGHEDQDDPEFAEALRLARDDEELRRWLEEQRDFDREMIRQLEKVSPPEGLYEDILHGVRVDEGRSETASPGKIVRAVFRAPGAWAVAAAVAVGLFVLLNGGGGSSEDRTEVYASLDCADCAVEVIDDLHSGRAALDLKTRDLAEVKQWLASVHGDLEVAAPLALERVVPRGCKTIQSKNGTVTILCFEQAGSMYHLASFELGEGHGEALPGEGAPAFTHHGDLVAATWRDGKVGRMLLTTQSLADEEELGRVVQLLTA